MKILYIGHYKENGGWGQAATNQILALDSVGLDVVCRNVTLTQDKLEVNIGILELEQKNTKDCDICIQHVLPHHLVGTQKFKKNIAFLEIETTSIKPLAWFDQLKQMDEIWVPNLDSFDSLMKDKIGVPVSIVPHTFDIDLYKRPYKEIEIPSAENKFKFYYVGDLNDRKNLESVITCFHSEFDRSENVALILKVKKFGHPKEQTTKIVDDILVKVKKSLRMYRDTDSYIKDIIIAEEISNDDIFAIHQYGDCFLCPSHGEAWSIPSFDAMAMGKTPICSNFGGPKQFIDMKNEYTGTLIDGVFSVCKCNDAAFADIFTGREFWFQPCEMQIRKKMRHYFELWQTNSIAHQVKSKTEGIKQAEKFSYKKIGKKMVNILEKS